MICIKYAILIGCFTYVVSHDLAGNVTSESQGKSKSKTLNTATAILKILEDSHDGEKLQKVRFMKNYKAAGGTDKDANQIYNLMSDNKDIDEIPIEDVEKNVEALVSTHLDSKTEKVYKDHVAAYKRKFDDESVEEIPIENNEVDGVEVEEIQFGEEDEQTKKNRKIIEDEFSQQDHLSAFKEDEDDYPEHEPMYQPSEEDDVDTLDDNGIESSQTAKNDEPVQSYADDFENIDVRQQKPVDPEILYEEMDDHEPIYQPEDQDPQESESQANSKENEEEIVPDIVISTDNNEETLELSDKDENEDGYPDHEPIYQPEDEEMSSEKVVVDIKENKRTEL